MLCAYYLFKTTTNTGFFFFWVSSFLPAGLLGLTLIAFHKMVLIKLTAYTKKSSWQPRDTTARFLILVWFVNETIPTEIICSSQQRNQVFAGNVKIHEFWNLTFWATILALWWLSNKVGTQLVTTAQQSYNRTRQYTQSTWDSMWNKNSTNTTFINTKILFVKLISPKQEKKKVTFL